MDRTKTPQQSADVLSRANRLVDPEQMGSLFKVMGISSPELGPLPAL
jgi:SAM-dependent MidA family methyltransferase